MGDLAEKPTRVRYGVMGYLCSLAFILYIDRICIGQAALKMQAELGMTKSQFGTVGVAFLIAYGIFEPMTGHWGDRYGSRRVLIRIVLWWSFFTALTGCVWNFSWQLFPGVAFNGFALLLVIRFLFGAGEAGALPNAARVVSCWFPPGKRGLPQALISAAAQIGGWAAPVITAYFINSPSIGWRWAFVIFGSLGVVWIWFFARGFRDDPASHPGVNEAERRYILAGREHLTAGQSAPHHVPWRLVVVNHNIWLLGIISFCTSSFAYMLFLWFPTYLKDGRGLGETVSGWVGGIPFAFGATGVLLGGYLGDWLTARTGSRRLSLCGMGTCGLLLGGVLVGGSVFVDQPVLAVLMCSTGYFFSYIQLAGWWAAMADIGGRHLGALFGVCNMMGLAGGAVSQQFLGVFVDYMEKLGYEGRARWDPAFYIYGGILLFGGSLWFLINPNRTIESQEQEDAGWDKAASAAGPP